MKASILIIVLTVLMGVIGGIFEIKSYYEYQNQYQSYWELADKSSTIEDKSLYVDKFVEVLENSGLQGSYNAVIYPTPTNSYDNNIKALKSLQSRLKEIKTMDVKSFEYQTAIQQITAQEQGEASAMLNVLSGCWMKVHYFFLWDWIGLTYWIIFGLGVFISFFAIVL